MRPDQFRAEFPGSLIRISGSEERHAFVPAPLPARWEWPTRLWPTLLDAHKALSALDGTGRHLPNPLLVLRPLQTREAVRSSSLEGTYTDPQQQALFELEPELDSSDDRSSQREVFNYGEALRLRQTSRDEIPLSLRLIRDLHRVLMTGVRGGDKNPGSFRQHQNQIGKPARFVPAPPERIAELLDSFEKYLHAPRSFDPLVEAFLVHYQFEAIHPFMDGNGRVGRLLLSILIEEWCGLKDQWLYMSSYFDDNKDEYMNRLFRVSSEGDWEGWVEFCLRGVAVQSVDTQKRCEGLLALHSDFAKRTHRMNGSVRLNAIVDSLFETPVARVAATAKRQGVSYPTARADLKKLEHAGILRELTGTSQIAYYAPDIMRVIYE
jgi:Fic family protein